VQNTFRFSTIVFKMLTFGMLVALFVLSSARAESSQNDKLVLGTVRLSLWYQGIEANPGENGPNSLDSESPAELERAMLRYSKEIEKVGLGSK